MRSLFLDRRFFLALAAVILLHVLGFVSPAFTVVGRAALVLLVVAVGVDLLLLYRRGAAVTAGRDMEERLSNGDENEVRVTIASSYPIPLRADVLDELPVQLQARSLRFDVAIPARGSTTLRYVVRPVTRGEYRFGVVNVLAATALGLVRRRFRCAHEQTIAVYPSFIQMRKYEILAISNRLEEIGVKKVRRVGHTMEFDQIREYVLGDDVRTVNWKATARRGNLMVNQYDDERSQPVYCIIDKGRAMKMPFNGMTLLDYAINASLVVSNIAVHKEDRAGLVCFDMKVDTFLAADRRRSQMRRIVELLYRQTTAFRESDFGALYAHTRVSIKGRSLLLLFTNFETLSGMRRRLPQLRAMARHHLLVVIFFENTELMKLIDEPASSVRGVYTKAVAERYALEKKLVTIELASHGILSILTAPEHLTVNAVNRYLEIKARRQV